jgi:hypothetical protein
VLGVVLALLALTAAPALASTTTFTPIGEISGPGVGVPFGSLKSESVAVNDHNGHVYVADSSAGLVYDFASPLDTMPTVWNGSGTPMHSFGGGGVAVAVDNASGDVYVADSTDRVIDKFDQNGTLIASFGDTAPAPNGQLAGLGTPATSFLPAEIGSFGIAVDQATHDLYAIDAGHQAVDAFDEGGAFLSQITSAPGELYGVGGHYTDGIAIDDKTKQILVSDSFDLKVYRFSLAGAFAPPAIDGHETPAGNFGGGYTSVAAENSGGRIYVNDTSHEVLDVLRPSGTYLTQITGTPAGSFGGVAVDQANGNVYVADGGSSAVKVFQATVVPGPTLGSAFPSQVTATSALLEGELNPEGLPTTYRFEYDTAPYAEGGPPHGTVTPAREAGSGESVLTVSAPVQGLAPATTYHYRLLAEDSFGTFTGPDRSFTTQGPSGPPLPDGRGWEMVSPPDKGGILLEGIGGIAGGGADIQAAADGSGLAYVARGAINAQAQGNRSPSDTQLLARRGSAGWSTRDVTAPNDVPHGVANLFLSEYQLFSSDLSLAVLVPQVGTTALSPQATERTPYLLQPDGSYLPLVTAANVPPGTQFGGEKTTFVGGGFIGDVRFTAATPDAAHVVLTSRQALTEPVFPAGVGGNVSLYEWSAGALTLLSQVPPGSATVCGGAGPACVPALKKGLGSLSSRDDSGLGRNTISSDGSRAVFLAGRDAGTQMFLRDAGRGETVQLDAVQGGEGGGGTVNFEDASTSGSRIFFTDGARLTPGSTANGDGERDLYMCEVGEVAGHLACTLKDLTVDHNPGEHASVQGRVIGAAADGSSVYFAANGALTAGAVHGNCESFSRSQSCNLYRYDAQSGETRLVAVLSANDVPDWGLGHIESLGALTARVSPGGRWLAFMSQRPLTGYDNRDAVSGERDEEVFLYDAQTGALHCASCNPTGARPRGVPDNNQELGLLVDRSFVWHGRTLAASIPGWTQVQNKQAFYQSRYLSDSGRLFFNAADALVPRDSNGTGDVYQYEPPGVGGCTQSSSPTYGVVSGGCVDLISSGVSGEESAFLDASESGNDVFFLTASQLASQDLDTALDVYDAHVCSGEVPCPPPPPPPAPACEGDACQSPVQAPNDPTPGSLSFHGPGNVTPGVTPPVVKKMVKCVKPKKLSHNKCVKPKRKTHKKGKAKKARRATSDRRAKR